MPDQRHVVGGPVGAVEQHTHARLVLVQGAGQVVERGLGVHTDQRDLKTVRQRSAKGRVVGRYNT